MPQQIHIGIEFSAQNSVHTAQQQFDQLCRVIIWYLEIEEENDNFK